jgi:hypothetical protein
MNLEQDFRMRVDIAPPCGDLGLHGGDPINNWHGETPVRREL